MTNLGFPAAEDPTNKKKINSVKQTATQVFCCRKNDQQHEERRKQPATPSKPVTYTLSAPFTSSHPTLNELEIPVEMVLTSLKQLDINKATGSDGIPVRLLKETADQISPSLTMLFNKSLRLGIFRETGNSRILYPFSRKERETLWRIIALFPYSLSSPEFSSAALWQVYGIIYLTSSVTNSMAF